MARSKSKSGPKAGNSFSLHMAKGELNPVYALVSAESTLLSEAITQLRDAVLISAPDFNRDEFRAGDTPMQRAVEAAGTLPMMAEKRWVHVYDISRIKAKDQDPLLAYLENPSPTTVFCLSGPKLDKRKKLGQRLSKSGSFFELALPKPREIPSWLGQRAAAKGIAVSVAAAHLLSDLIGADVGALDRAVEKAANYAGDNSVDTAHVEATVVATRMHSIFELTDAIGARDMAKASQLLRNALDGGEQALIILSMIARQLRQLLRAKSLGGGHPGEVARALGVPPFLADSLLQQASRYSRGELSRGLLATADADARLKSTRLSRGVVLDRLLVDLMGEASS